MIELKDDNEIKKIEKSCRIVADVLRQLKEKVKPGIRTIELDEEAHRIIKKSGGRPAFLGYRGYPRSVCVSINEEVVHGIPSKNRIIKEGDIVSLDYGIELDGYFGDAAITVGAGNISGKAKRLIEVTEKALYAGIDKARPGNKLFDISAAIQKCAESNGFSVVRDFVGHGIGKKMHEEPMVPNYGKEGTGFPLQAGMVIAIEPMVNEKSWEVMVLDDEWTVVTKDKGLSAHFEHTVAITAGGPVILSK
jgi:methionyl aminopeptidase